MLAERGGALGWTGGWVPWVRAGAEACWGSFPACASPVQASLRPPSSPVIPNPADACSPDCPAVTVADYANSDPAVVKTGRVKKAVANAVQQEGESAEGSLPPLSTGLCLGWETPSPRAEQICLIQCLKMSLLFLCRIRSSGSWTEGFAESQ